MSGLPNSNVYVKCPHSQERLRLALILVTGAAGFIGSHISRALSLLGHKVVASDLLGNGIKWRNMLGTQFHDFILPDALLGWMTANANELEFVVHFGALSDTTEVNTDLLVKNNVRLSLDLWNWCIEHNSRFVYASSAATYGNGAHGFLDDNDSLALGRLRPLNAYGWSKQFVDLRIMSDVEAGQSLPGQWIGLKLFNVYGPGEEHKGDMQSLISKIIPTIKSGGIVQLFKSYDSRYADGAQMRDFVYVDDITSIVCWIIANPSISGLFNVGSGVARTWNDVVTITSECLRQPVRIEYVEMPDRLRAQYQYYTQAPIEKLRIAGWSDRATSLEQGILTYLSLTC